MFRINKQILNISVLCSYMTNEIVLQCEMNDFVVEPLIRLCNVLGRSTVGHSSLSPEYFPSFSVQGIFKKIF